MKRGIKIFGGVVLALVVLGAVFLLQSGWIRPRGANLEAVLADDDEAQSTPSVASVPSDPSARQQWFVNAVRDATGRHLAIEGDFAAWILPAPGLLIGKASLSNEEGFGDTPFATIDGLEIRVGSISPFDMEVEVERAALAGLRLNFMRDAEGRTNWSDFGDDAEVASGAPAGGTPAPSAETPAQAAPDENWRVAVDRIEIIDAEVSLQDAFAGREWKLGAVDFLASELKPGAPFPVALAFTYTSGATAVTIESAARASIATNRWRFDELSIALSGGGPGWVGLLGDARLDVGSLDADLVHSRAVYEGIELRLHRFDPDDLVAVLDSLGVTIDSDLLARAGASASIHLSGGGTVDQGARTLDLSGSLRLSDGSVVPLTIGGTLDAPRVEVRAGR